MCLRCVCTHFNSCTHCSPMRRCEKMTYRWQITFPQSLSQRDTGSNMCRVLSFAKQISSDRHSLCMGGCTCAAPPAPNCVCVASVVWSGVWEQAGCCLPVYHSPHKAQCAPPSPVLPQVSKGTVSKSNKTLLHRIPLGTRFRFMQAHIVGHFHSFRKRGQASKPSCVVETLWISILFHSSFSVKGDIKREMQVTRHPRETKSSRAGVRPVSHCRCPFFHTKIRFSTSHQTFKRTYSWSIGE